MNLVSIVFCGASLALSLLAAALLYPYAAISEYEPQASRTATPAYQMGELDLGDFGRVSVQELTDYYIENPRRRRPARQPPVRSVSRVVDRRGGDG